MSCYFRYIKDLLEEAKITVTDDNKKDIDKAFHRTVGVEYKDCSSAWKRIKEITKKEDENARTEFIKKLRSNLT